MSMQHTLVGFIWRGRINIGNAATGTNLLAALRTAGYYGPDACAVKIASVDLAGADRALLTVATVRNPGTAIAAADFTTHGEPVKSGESYTQPCDQDAALSYIRAPGGAITAQVSVLW